MTDLASHFLKPKNKTHKRYEVLRAAFVEQLPLRIIAERFGYSYGTVRNLCSEFQKQPNLDFFLPHLRRVEPPRTETPPSQDTRLRRNQRVRQLRKERNLSVREICVILHREDRGPVCPPLGAYYARLALQNYVGVPRLRNWTR